MCTVFVQNVMVTYKDVAAITAGVCWSSLHWKATEILQNRRSVWCQPHELPASDITSCWMNTRTYKQAVRVLQNPTRLTIYKYIVCFPHSLSVQHHAGQGMRPIKAEVKECRVGLLGFYAVQILLQSHFHSFSAERNKLCRQERFL